MLNSCVSKNRASSIQERSGRHVLIIGGAGYIGNVLIRKLLSLGYQVRCLDALYYSTGNTIAPLMDRPRFSFVRGDLRNVDVVRSGLGDHRRRVACCARG